MRRNLDIMHLILADVRTQSAQDLVNGVSAKQEKHYSLEHYYGE